MPCMALCTPVELTQDFVLSMLLLFCTQHAYILSDPVIHLKLSLRQLPTQGSLLPQSWSQLGSPECIATCAFVCSSLFDVYPECACACVCVHVCAHPVLARTTLPTPRFINVLIKTQPDRSLRHKMAHKSNMMWSNLLFRPSQTTEAGNQHFTDFCCQLLWDLTFAALLNIFSANQIFIIVFCTWSPCKALIFYQFCILMLYGFKHYTINGSVLVRPMIFISSTWMPRDWLWRFVIFMLC